MEKVIDRKLAVKRDGPHLDKWAVSDMLAELEAGCSGTVSGKKGKELGKNKVN